MSILKLLASDGFITFNVEIARQTSINSAILLGYLASWQGYSKGEWFYQTREAIEEKTTMSRKMQAKAEELLIQKGFLQMKLMGIPAKNYYLIDNSNMLNILKCFQGEEQSVMSGNIKKSSILSDVTKGNNKALQKGTPRCYQRSQQYVTKGENINNNNIRIIDNYKSTQENEFLQNSESGGLEPDSCQGFDGLDAELSSEKEDFAVFVDDSVVENSTKKSFKSSIIEDFAIKNDCQILAEFETQPNDKWTNEKLQKYGNRFFFEVLAKIAAYCKANPSYTEKRKSLPLVFSAFSKHHETEFILKAKEIFSAAYAIVFGELYEFQGSDSKHLEQLLGKISASIEKLNGTSSEAEALQGLEKMLSMLPDKYRQAQNFKPTLINYNYQAIKNEIKNGKSTNNRKGIDIERLLDFITD